MPSTITRTPWIDDDGSGTTGTVINNAVKTELYDQIDALAAKIEGADTTEAFAAQHDPATGAHTDISAANVNIATNLGALDASIGRNLTAAYLFATNGVRERSRSVPMGEWQAVPFNAANFIAGTGAWTVTAGQIQSNRYMLIGKTLFWNLSIGTSTVTGPTTWVYAVLPGGLLSAAVSIVPVPYAVEAGALVQGSAHAGAASPNLGLLKGFGAVGWNGSLQIAFNIALEIQ